MMKIFFFIAVSLILFGAATNAQDESAQLLDAVNALKRQQVQIAENQTKLDQQMADVAETIREARIFMSRAGGKHKPPPPPK
jgi:hypothetical protein